MAPFYFLSAGSLQIAGEENSLVDVVTILEAAINDASLLVMDAEEREDLNTADPFYRTNLRLNCGLQLSHVARHDLRKDWKAPVQTGRHWHSAFKMSYIA